MKWSLVLLALLALAAPAAVTGVAGVQGPARAERDNRAPMQQERFDQLVARWLKESLALDPLRATALGVHEHDDEVGDFSADGFGARSELAQRYLKELESIELAQLPAPAQADHRVLQGALKVAIRELDQLRTWKRAPSLYADAPAEAIFLMVSREYAPLEDRLNNVLERMRKIPEVLEAAKRNLSDPPRIWTEIAMDSTRGDIEFFESVIPSLAASSTSLRESLGEESRRVSAAYREYLKFLEQDLLARSGGDFRAGKEDFEFYLKNQYLMEESSDQLLGMGQLIYDRTRKQLADVAKLIDSTRDWKAVLDGVKQRHPPAAELLEEYRKESARARAFVLRKDLVDIPEGDSLRIVETPLFQRSIVPFAQYYIPGPFDQDRTGTFTVTPIDTSRPQPEQEAQLRGHSHGSIVNTVVHEAYPGHHLQFVYASRISSTVRKVLPSAIFSEGWALYTEELLSENGYYTPEERLIQLQWTLVRAARVLIDIGLHAGSMTFEDAVDLLVDEVRLERPAALGEVKRYTLSPTQPLSYLTGRELILRTRTEYARKQGRKYKVKNFHTELLAYGAIPPALIREMMSQKGLLAR